jgi:hypothetical protein
MAAGPRIAIENVVAPRQTGHQFTWLTIDIVRGDACFGSEMNSFTENCKNRTVPDRPTPAGDVDYESSGAGYALRRQADPRLAALISALLGDARSVLNVGAGAGSYEPSDRYVIAVEPSDAMRSRRPVDGPVAVDATAEKLPFDRDSFDAAIAIFTVHQWTDVQRGLGELRRVARGPVVVMTLDVDALERFWLNDYLPTRVEVERSRFPSVPDLRAGLGGRTSVEVVPIPRD